MKFAKAKKKLFRLGQLVLILAVLVCIVFALISTFRLSESINLGNRKIVLNYGNQIASRLHDLFERVDISLATLSRDISALDDVTTERTNAQLNDYKEIWNAAAIGLMYNDGVNLLSDGNIIVFDNEISLRDVLSYSQKLNITRQAINGQDMLVFAKPCDGTADGKNIDGVFTAIEFERLESLLGDYGYGNDSFMVLTQNNGDIIWKQGDDTLRDDGNCFAELRELDINKDDSILQIQTRMTVNLDGTIAYSRDGQSFYIAYVPLDVNYWYLLVSTRSDSIDLTELARQHFIISAVLIGAILVMCAASFIYLIQRNRVILRYNKQLQVATAMQNQADKANQANKAKQEFLANVSHDIRTPLNGVIGMLTLAKEEYSSKDKCIGYLDKASVSAQYLLSLLNDVLNMSQIESGKHNLVIENVDMNRLLAEIEAIMENSTAKKSLSFTIDDNELSHRHFRGDELRIKQILMNLLSNAVKYTHEGGQILLKVSEVEANDVTNVIFRVIDNGEGISEDKIDTIFMPFEQASMQRQGGVGLGLSIVRSFVDLMGGKITVESQAGVGSIFTVTLPLEGTTPDEKDTQAVEQHNNLEGIRILLAEDNDINAEIAISLLELRGAVVTLAQDGEAVVRKYSEMPQDSFDIILMDIQMPRLNGLDATRQIRSLNRPDATTIPILSMTANAFHEQKDEMREAGIDDFLYKPIDIDIVCKCIRKWVKEA